MSASGGDLERALGTFLPLDIREIERAAFELANPGLGTCQNLRTFEMVGELDQRLCGNDLDFGAGPGCFSTDAAGQINPGPRPLAPIAAGNTPATGAIEPSRPSSPRTVKLLSASCGMAPIAAISPSAIGKS